MPAVLTEDQLNRAKKVAGIFMPYAMRRAEERYPTRSGTAKFVQLHVR